MGSFCLSEWDLMYFKILMRKRSDMFFARKFSSKYPYIIEGVILLNN